MKNNRFLFLIVLGILLVVLAGCGGAASTPAPTSGGTTSGGNSSVSFSKDVLPIFTSRCTSCHGGSNPRAGVDLSSYDAVMNSGAITAGDAQNSVLVQAVQIGQMPRSGGRLSAAQVQLIADWVNAGAPNN